MMTSNAEIAIVRMEDKRGSKKSAKEKVNFDFSFVQFEQLSDVKKELERHALRVLITDYDPKSLTKLSALKKEVPKLQLILVGSPNSDDLGKGVESLSPYAVATSWTDPFLRDFALEALERYYKHKESDDLSSLISVPESSIEILTEELALRVKEKEKRLTKSHLQLKKMNGRIQFVHRFLSTVFEAKSFRELEQKAQEILSSELGVVWSRIIFDQPGSASPGGPRAGQAFQVLELEVPSQLQWKAKWYLAKEKSDVWSEKEKDEMTELTEFIAVSLNRLYHLEQAEHLKQQWETTFDAITHPLCLMNKSFRLARVNKAFIELSGMSFAKLIGSPPLEHFGFSVQSTEHLEKLKEIEIRGRTFHLQFQKLEVDQEPLFLLLLNDVSERKKLEKQMIESSKLVELGTIGSSIAHELNNPLGGMLSFAQLIKMDVAKTSPHFPDLVEMEQGLLRCKEIVQSLLDFTRASENISGSPDQIREKVLEALKIKDFSYPD